MLVELTIQLITLVSIPFSLLIELLILIDSIYVIRCIIKKILAPRARGQKGKGLCSPGGDTHHTKTDKDGTEDARTEDAIRRTAVIRVEVP